MDEPVVLRDADEAAMWRQKALEVGPGAADDIIREYQRRALRPPHVIAHEMKAPRARIVRLPAWTIPGRLVRVIATQRSDGSPIPADAPREGVLAWEPWRGIEGCWTVLDPLRPNEPLHAWPCDEDPTLHVEAVEAGPARP